MVVDVTKKENEVQEFVIGKFNVDEEFLNEAITGANNKLIVDKIGELTVSVFGREGPVPHVHVYNKDNSFDSCICLHDSVYFPHGGEHQSKFNKASQKKDFNEWMSKIHPEKSMTNFEVAKSVWNDINRNHKIDLIISTQPDYNLLDADFNSNLRKKIEEELKNARTR